MTSALRLSIVAVALTLGLLAPLHALGANPKPEPANSSFKPLSPDPPPSPQPTPSTRPTQTASSGGTSVHSSTPAPTYTPASTSTPAATVTSHTVSPPAAGQASTTRPVRHATRQRVRATKHTAPAVRKPPARAHRALRLSLLLPFLDTKVRDEVFATGSSHSTLLLIGAFALVVLALGETTLLTAFGRRARVRREPAPAGYSEVDVPIRRGVRLER